MVTVAQCLKGEERKNKGSDLTTMRASSCAAAAFRDMGLFVRSVTIEMKARIQAGDCRVGGGMYDVERSTASSVYVVLLRAGGAAAAAGGPGRQERAA